MTTLTLNDYATRKLYAAHFCAEKPWGSRPYIQGVRVEFCNPQQVRFTATDGHILASFAADLDDGHQAEYFEPFTIPVDLIKDIPKPKSKFPVTAFLTRRDTGEIEITVEVINGNRSSETMPEIKKGFPPYERVRPHEDDLKPCHQLCVNMDIVKRVHEMAKAVRGKQKHYPLALYTTCQKHVEGNVTNTVDAIAERRTIMADGPLLCTFGSGEWDYLLLMPMTPSEELSLPLDGIQRPYKPEFSEQPEDSDDSDDSVERQKIV